MNIKKNFLIGILVCVLAFASVGISSCGEQSSDNNSESDSSAVIVTDESVISDETKYESDGCSDGEITASTDSSYSVFDTEAQSGNVELKTDKVSEKTESESETKDLSSDSSVSNNDVSQTEIANQTSKLTWEEFYALSPEEKDKYLESFPNYGDFVLWMKDAQAQFRKDYPEIEIGADGSVDLSKILK